MKLRWSQMRQLGVIRPQAPLQFGNYCGLFPQIIQPEGIRFLAAHHAAAKLGRISGGKEAAMMSNPAESQPDELKLEAFAAKPYERRMGSFFLAILASLLLHGTIAVALVQGLLG